MENGNAYSRENRQMIVAIKDSVKDIKDSVTYLTNHYGRKIPAWATIVISILTALVGALTTAIVMALI